MDPRETHALLRIVGEQHKDDVKTDGELWSHEMKAHQAGYGAIVSMIASLGKALSRSR